MARTTDADVRAVIPTDEDVSMAPFIANASVLTDRVETTATANGVTMTSAEYKFIETYLAAHLYALRYPQATQKKAGRSSVKYEGKYGVGLEATRWGQTAITLDISGTLATTTGADGGVKTVDAVWLGTEEG